MAKLNQIISVENGVKSKAKDELTRLYHLIQKTALFTGISRTYTPKDDDGDKLPSESTLVQVKVPEVLESVESALTRLFDVTLTKEVANTEAAADIKVGDVTLATAVPVTYLLFLEKQLVDIRSFIGKLPVLDPAVRWEYDSNSGVNKTDPVQTVKTKKTPRNWVKAEATDKHPAQVEIFYEDLTVGTWTKIDTSGAISSTRRAELLERVDKLITAVKYAREEANSLDVADYTIASDIFGYLFR
jgi:hypothetical protein